MHWIKTSTLDILVWVALYAGLLTWVLGVFVGWEDSRLGGGIQLAGGLLAATGVLLLWLRSRRDA
jgi:hypothetical protein